MSAFLWGAATAAFQIEGAANLNGRTDSIWDTFSRIPGKINNGDTADRACNHYELYENDLDLMQWMGLSAYRFSISWSRILPNGIGEINQEGIEFYNRLIDGLISRGITPFLTIYHWDLPQALHDRGGWQSRESVDWFKQFTQVLADNFGDRVKNWITINEPHCIAWFGYYRGWFAPGIKDLQSSIDVVHHLLLSHGYAVTILRNSIPEVSIGISLGLTPVSAASNSPEDIAAADFMDGYDIRWFLDPIYGRAYPQSVLDRFKLSPPLHKGDLEIISTPLDFLGVNFYLRQVVKNSPENEFFGVSGVDTPDAKRTAMGWEINPESLKDLLIRLKDDYKPSTIFITENGSAWDDVLLNGEIDDEERISYLNSHLNAMKDAISEGVPVQGYFAWSLLDNFEWTHGFSKRFGLIHVDYETLIRTPKKSAYWYRNMISEEKKIASSISVNPVKNIPR